MYAIVSTSDGGYLLGRGNTNNEGYLMKVNSNGEKVWEKSLGSDSYSGDFKGPVYAICEMK